MEEGENNRSRAAKHRSVLACTRCKGRKTRCIGKPGQACAYCRSKNIACSFAFMQAIAQVDERRGSTTPSSTTQRTTNGSSARSVDTPTQAPTTSSSIQMTNRLSEAFGVSIVEPPRTASHRHSPSLAEIPKLPSEVTAMRLFDAQRKFVGKMFPIVSQERFRQSLRAVSSPNIDLSSPSTRLQVCEVLLILAFGMLYSINQWAGGDGPPGVEYFRHALRFLPPIYETESVDFVGCLLLVSYYMQILDWRRAAFLHLGVMIRMAMTLGLHEPLDPGTTDPNIIQGHRVWLAAYILDRTLSARSGYPEAAAYHEICPIIATLEPSDDTMYTVLCHHARLASVYGRCNHSEPSLPNDMYDYSSANGRRLGVYQNPPIAGETLIREVLEAIRELECCLEKAPPEIRNQVYTGNDTMCQDGLLALQFHGCVMMVVRPLVLHAINQRLKHASDPDSMPTPTETESRIVGMAVSAARASVKILQKAASASILATYGYLDGEQAFSASLLLIMTTLAWPGVFVDDATVTTSLSILEHMANLGNEQIQAQLRVLQQIRDRFSDNMPSFFTSTPSQSSTHPPQSTSSVDIYDIDLTGFEDTFDPLLWDGAFNQSGAATDMGWALDVLNEDRQT